MDHTFQEHNQHTFVLSMTQYPFAHLIHYPSHIHYQDRFSIQYVESIGALFISVFDGHLGFDAAQFANEHLHKILIDQIPQEQALYKKQFDKMMVKILNQGYQQLENRYLDYFEQQINSIQPLKNNPYFQKNGRCGTCALTLVITKETIYVCNLGDSSSAILNNDSLIKLNKVLNANEESQRKRLLKKFKEKDIVVDYYNFTQNKRQYYVKERLQPTYSIGDFYLKYPKHNYSGIKPFKGPYIQHKPQIFTYEVNENMSKLLIGSDGFWDYISQESITFIYKSNPEKESLATEFFNQIMNNILKKIVKSDKVKTVEINLKWLNNLQNKKDYLDDITLIQIDMGSMLTFITNPESIKKSI